MVITNFKNVNVQCFAVLDATGVRGKILLMVGGKQHSISCTWNILYLCTMYVYFRQFFCLILSQVEFINLLCHLKRL